VAVSAKCFTVGMAMPRTTIKRPRRMSDWVSEGLGFEVMGWRSGLMKTKKFCKLSDAYRDGCRLLGEIGGMAGIGFDSK
jgi:hypothetical protein